MSDSVAGRNDFLHQVVREDLTLCGCGNGQNEEAVFLVRDILDAIAEAEEEGHPYDGGHPFDRTTKLVGSSGGAYIVLTGMLNAGLIEYAGRITNPWTTDKGKQFAKEVSRYADDDALYDAIEGESEGE